MYAHDDLLRLAAVASALEHGLDINRLLFARYLLRAGHLTERLAAPSSAQVFVPTAPCVPRILQAMEWTAWT
jgi:hypothetical protein